MAEDFSQGDIHGFESRTGHHGMNSSNFSLKAKNRAFCLYTIEQIRYILAWKMCGTYIKYVFSADK